MMNTEARGSEMGEGKENLGSFDWRRFVSHPDALSADHSRRLDELALYMNTAEDEVAREFLAELSDDGKRMMGSDPLATLVQCFRHKNIPALELTEPEANDLLHALVVAGKKYRW